MAVRHGSRDMGEVSNEGKIGYSSSMHFSSSDILYMLKDLPDACCIFKVMTDPFGTVKDMLFLFANEKYGQLVGKNSAELVGNTFFKSVPNRDEDWVKYSYQAAILRQSSIVRTYNTNFDKWFEFWSVPVYQKGFCAFIIHDVTAVKKNEESTVLASNTNELIIECAKEMSSAEFGKGIKRVLKNLGQAIEADRVFTVEVKDNAVTDSHIWQSSAKTSELPSRKVLEQYDIVPKWGKALEKRTALVVNDTATILEINEELYYSVLAGRIYRYIVLPLRSKRETIGYLVAENYSNDLPINIVEVMESVGVFLAYELRNRALNEELRHLGSHDALTGLGNRHSLNQTMAELEEEPVSVGICYSDINGLKNINDEYGHQAGDAMIVETGKVFASVFKKKYSYRIGGDEFIAIIPDIDEDIFKVMVEKLIQKTNKVSVAVGWVWEEDSKNIRAAIRKADEAMYDSKADYYKTHERRHRS